MNISQSDLVHASPEDVASLLYNSGLNLAGKPLRRASWLEIAKVLLGTGPMATVILARLQAAKNREDALRVLRIARKQSAHYHKGGSAKAKSNRRPKSAVVQRQLSYDDIAYNDADMFYGYDFDFDYYGDFLALQAPQSDYAFPPTEFPPLSRVQALALAVAWQRQRPTHDMSVRAAIGEETYQQLVAVVAGRTVILTPEEEQFFTVHKLDHLLDATSARPIKDGFGLAGLDILARRHKNVRDYVVHWEAVAQWFGHRLRQAPDDDLLWLVTAVHFFVENSPVEAAQVFLAHLCLDPEIHADWLALLPYMLSRLYQLLPDLQLDKIDAQFSSRWGDLLYAGVGSALPLCQMRDNLADLMTGAVNIPGERRHDLHRLLTAGGGTLRGQPYPEFTLVARPIVSMVSIQTLRTMQGLLQPLYDAQRELRHHADRAFTELLGMAHEVTGMPKPQWKQVQPVLVEHAIGYVLLVEEVFPNAGFRIRRKHVRRFWEKYHAGELSCSVPPNTLKELANRFGIDRLIEGTVHALLGFLDERWPGPVGGDLSLQETFIVTLRTLAVVYRAGELTHLEGTEAQGAPAELARTVADVLLRQSMHAPLELAQALGIAHEQGFPLLAGGRMTEWEHRVRHVLREAAGGIVHDDADQPPRVFHCRPLSKIAALERGGLGGDCSSQVVPLRATSPHHTYYGIWEKGKQQRGYMAVFEAWAENEEAQRIPVLCLETINVPIPVFDAVQQDLLLIFDAIAQSRGLSTPIVLSMGYGTWNYQNGEMLRVSRRFRQGEAVALEPADPVYWELYGQLSREAYYYSSFNTYRGSGLIRILAPFDPVHDRVQPENLVEAERLAAIPAATLQSTMPGDGGIRGFISSWPLPFGEESDSRTMLG